MHDLLSKTKFLLLNFCTQGMVAQKTKLLLWQTSGGTPRRVSITCDRSCHLHLPSLKHRPSCCILFVWVVIVDGRENSWPCVSIQKKERKKERGLNQKHTSTRCHTCYEAHLLRSNFLQTKGCNGVSRLCCLAWLVDVCLKVNSPLCVLCRNTCKQLVVSPGFTATLLAVKWVLHAPEILINIIHWWFEVKTANKKSVKFH